MAPGCSTSSAALTASYDTGQRQLLTELARRSIAWGLEHGRPLPVTAGDYPATLREPRACFVTLKCNGQLRGCIGSIEAHRSLAEDLANNAWAAAFEDPRFAPLGVAEMADLEIHISVLSVTQPMRFESEKQLLGQLRPGIDGLILRDGQHRGTFLPSVWESLPSPQDFLNQLKLKAGLPADYWSDSITVERYTTESW